MTEPLIVQAHELRELRFATLDRLLEDTRVLEGHLTNAVEKEHGLAVRDAQSWGRMVPDAPAHRRAEPLMSAATTVRKQEVAVERRVADSLRSEALTLPPDSEIRALLLRLSTRFAVDARGPRLEVA